MYIDKLPISRHQRFILLNFIDDIQVFLVGCVLLFFASTSVIAAQKHMFEAQAAEFVGGASKVAVSATSGGYLVSLTKPGQGVKFATLPAAGKLAIRYRV
jgi:hypothetical protein